MPPEVTQFLSQQPLAGVIGGELVLGAKGETFVTRDPGSGESLADVVSLGMDEVDRAVRAADEAIRQTGAPGGVPGLCGIPSQDRG